MNNFVTYPAAFLEEGVTFESFDFNYDIDDGHIGTLTLKLLSQDGYGGWAVRKSLIMLESVGLVTHCMAGEPTFSICISKTETQFLVKVYQDKSLLVCEKSEIISRIVR